MILNDAEKAGGKEYSELCALAYRQTVPGGIEIVSRSNSSSINACIA